MALLLLLLATAVQATYPIQPPPVYSNSPTWNTKPSNITQGTSLLNPSTKTTTPSTITPPATLPSSTTISTPTPSSNQLSDSGYHHNSSSLESQCGDIYTKDYLSFFQAAPPTSSFVYTAHPPCCGTCELFGADVQVYFWPPAGGSNTSTDTSIMVDSLGFTFHSPSIYVGFKSLHATDLCSTGKTVTTTTLAFSVGELSTDIGYRYDRELYLTNPPYIPPTFTKAVWGDQHQSCRNITTTFWQRRRVAEMLTAVDEAQKSTLDHYTVSYNPCSPTIAVPTGLFQAHPFWVSCSPGLAGFYDPPSALRPYTGSMPAPTQMPQPQPTYQPYPALPINEADPIPPPIAPTPYPTQSPVPVVVPNPDAPKDADSLPVNNEVHIGVPLTDNIVPNKAEAETPTASENQPAKPADPGYSTLQPDPGNIPLPSSGYVTTDLSHLPENNDKPIPAPGYVATHSPNNPGNQLPSPPGSIATHLPNGPGNQILPTTSSMSPDAINSTGSGDKNKVLAASPTPPIGDVGVGGMIASLGGFDGAVASSKSPISIYGNTTHKNETVEFQGAGRRVVEAGLCLWGITLGCTVLAIGLL